MLRILWIFSLALIIGAHKNDSWKHDLKSFFETLTREMNLSLQKSLSLFPEVPTASSHPESTSTNPCEYASNCHPDSSTTSTAGPVFTPKPGTLDDYHSLQEESATSSSQQNRQQVGSMKGTPGENFPDYTDIPATSFSCSNQDYVPGFYADLESRCQVFHACWPHRRESFLCPVGTTFNQALLACDYWYSSNCSLAPHYYNVNGYSMKSTDEDTPEGSMINDLLKTEQESSKEELKKILTSEQDSMDFISQFLPVKAKVTVYPKTPDSKWKIVATASVGKRKKRHHPPTESQDFTQESQSTTEGKVTEEAQYSTLSPDCTETIKYINVEAAVKLFFERIYNIVKDIIREVREYMAANAAKTVCSTAHTDKISMWTKIKHKLIPRPLVPPMVEEEEPVITSKTDAAVDPTVTKPSVADFHKISLSHTKKALIENIINLLKLKKG